VRRLIAATTRGAYPPLRPEALVPRKPNYDFHKRRKELDRKAEKDEKIRRKREKAATERDLSNSAVEPPAAVPGDDASLPPDR
jgi:hypothetical protein